MSDRLTKTSNKGGTALTFDVDITDNNGCMNNLVEVFKKLKHYEDLEEQDNWIPCSERLPIIPTQKIKEGFHRVEVMATVKGSEVPVQLVWFDIENNEFYDDWDWFASKFNKEDILAWQALPEPYKEADFK